MREDLINYTSAQLINLLYKQRDWITAEFISRQLGISVRSIKSYISKLNQNTDWIISSHRGYKINPDHRNTILNYFEINNIQVFYESSKHRPEYILKKLITSSQGYNIFELSEALFVSTSTLKADFNKLKPLLNKHQLSLAVSNNIYSIEGTEKNKRKLISSILIKESHLGFSLKDVAKDLISAHELEIITQSLKKSLHYHSYYINDYALFNLIACLVIAVNRIRHQCTLANVFHIASLDETEEYKISREIFLSLKEQLAIDLHEEEIIDFSLLIASLSVPIRYNEVNKKNLVSIVNPEVIELIHEIIAKVNKTYYIDLNVHSFYSKFALHLQNLLLRAKIKQFCINPLTQSIKESCPFIYEISVFIADIIDEKLDILLDENEIAYIALHIGSVFNAENTGDKLSTLLVCPNYYDLTKHLYLKITDRFNEFIYISNTEHGKEIDTKNSPYDLILTAIDLPITDNTPTLKINIFPTNKDWKNISNLIQEINTARNLDRIRNILFPLFRQQLFAYNPKWTDHSEAIKNICKIMVDEGYVDSDYDEFVFARESISSTVFGNVAIPHSLNPRGKKTGIFVSIHSKPLKWGNHSVTIVFLLAIHPNDQHYFSEILNKLTEVLSSQKNIAKLSKCKDFNRFLDTLSKLS